MNMTALTNPVMSSLEIAELTGKEHKNVMADIRRMLVEIQSAEKLADYRDGLGRTQPCLMLDKEETICLVSGYSAQLRIRIIRRWQELEQQANQPAMIIPQTLPEALRLAAELAEQKMELERKVALDAPAVEFAKQIASIEKGSPCRHSPRPLALAPPSCSPCCASARS